MLRLDPRRSFVQLGHGAYQKRVWATVTSATADISVDVAGNKELTNRLLHEIGIPVPRADVVRSAGEAAEVARRIGYPVVLKPLDGNHGRGVMINLPDEAAVHEAFPAADARAGMAVVGTFIGKDYRILVVNNQVVAVAERVPAPSSATRTPWPSWWRSPIRILASALEDPDPHHRRRADDRGAGEARAWRWTTCRRRAASSSSS